MYMDTLRGCGHTCVQVKAGAQDVRNNPDDPSTLFIKAGASPQQTEPTDVASLTSKHVHSMISVF